MIIINNENDMLVKINAGNVFHGTLQEEGNGAILICYEYPSHSLPF